MNVRVLLSLCVATLILGWVAVPGLTEDEPAGGQPAAGDEQPWEAMGKRGPEHEWMGFMVGSWDAKGKFWMGPGEPTVTTGTMESYWINSRRFVRSNYSGEWDDNTFQGEATMGFDNATQKFVTIWLDTMSTGISRTMGTREGDVITLHGKSTVPQMGEVKTTATYTKKSDDAYTLEEVWEIPNMGQMKVMEIVYERAE